MHASSSSSLRSSSLAGGLALLLLVSGFAHATTPPLKPSPPVATTTITPSGEYVNAAAGFRLTPPSGWHLVEHAGFAVPGELRAGWSRDDLSSILVFTVHLTVPVNPAFLLVQQRAAAKKLHAQIGEAQQRTIAGMQAMSFVLTAAGTGGAIDTSGEDPTSQHWIAIPHQTEVLFVLLTAPADVFGDYEPIFRGVLDTLKVDWAQTADQAVPR
jgi:hypothetical protein